MPSNVLRVAAVVAAAVVWAGAGPTAPRASAAPAEGQKKKPAGADKANRLEGVLAAIDASHGEIRVVSATKDPATGVKSEDDRTIAVAANARITLAGEGKDKATAVKLADLKDGMRVVVVLSGDGKTATEVHAAPKVNAVAGAVRAVDAARRTVTATVKDKTSGDKTDETLNVAADASVVFEGHTKGGGKTGRLADLREGMSVTLRLTEDRKTVTGIRVAPPTARGVVKAVDAAKGSITVTVGVKGDARDVTYEVEKGAAVRVDGKEAKLADVKPGTPVELLLSPEDGGVVGLRAGEKGKVK